MCAKIYKICPGYRFRRALTVVAILTQTWKFAGEIEINQLTLSDIYWSQKLFFKYMSSKTRPIILKLQPKT